MDVQALVLDPGSTMMKAGFAGDDAPRVKFFAILHIELILGCISFHCGSSTIPGLHDWHWTQN